MSFSQFLPRRLQSNYRSIMNGNLVQSKVMDENSLRLLQALLNESQAQDQDESLIQKTVQFLYRQNTSSFYKFLTKNKLAYVVLWTESKCIVRHLGLQGLVYIRWNQDERMYEVFPHKNVLDRQSQTNQRPNTDRKEHTSVDRIVAEINKDLPETPVETKVETPVETPVETKFPEVPISSRSWADITEEQQVEVSNTEVPKTETDVEVEVKESKSE